MRWGDNLTHDKGVIISDEAYIDVHLGKLHIGANTHILDGVKIWTHNHQWQPYSDDELPNDIEIGANCIIGAYSLIVPPCKKIVDNVVIGAGSVIREDILEPGVYVTSQLRKIK